MRYIDGNEPGRPIDEAYDAAVHEYIRRRDARIEGRGRQQRIRMDRPTFDDLALGKPHNPGSLPAWAQHPANCRCRGCCRCPDCIHNRKEQND